MLMSLGLFVFNRQTVPFLERDRRSSWRHGSTDRFGARPATQYLGPGEDEMSLGGLIVPELAGRHSELRTLREMADAGDAWPLVDGAGEVLGDYVITAIDDRASQFLDNGVPRRVDFTINLRRVA